MPAVRPEQPVPSVDELVGDDDEPAHAEPTVDVADEVLAKHDENYMPPEVVDALEKAGVWQDEAAASLLMGKIIIIMAISRR